jgi:hypothetical protein
MPDLLIQAMTAKQSGNLTLAKQLLSQALVQNPSNEGAWMLMADVVGDAKLRRDCLERVLGINPGNTAASLALTKMDTSPLAPITRGERNKPLNPPNIEKTPAFTPPFTWESEEKQFLALGDLTFPELKAADPDRSLDISPTFDWATDEEPDKAIQKIFDALSNPELVSQPLPDTDLIGSDKNQVDDQTGSTTVEDQKIEDKWLDELVGTKEEPPKTQQPASQEDYSVSAEPQSGLDNFISTEQAEISPTEINCMLWDNPKAKVDRLVILTNKSIIYANPSTADIPHIMGLFHEKKMLRDLLGEDTRIIKLESIQRITSNPKRTDLRIDYKADEKSAHHVLTFTNRQVRDEALIALRVRLDPRFLPTTHTFSLEQKILSPVLTLVLVAALGWLLTAGLPLFNRFLVFQSGIPQVILSNLQALVDAIGVFTLLIVASIGGVLCLIWLIINLVKPSEMVILER